MRSVCRKFLAICAIVFALSGCVKASGTIVISEDGTAWTTMTVSVDKDRLDPAASTPDQLCELLGLDVANATPFEGDNAIGCSSTQDLSVTTTLGTLEGGDGYWTYTLWPDAYEFQALTAEDFDSFEISVTFPYPVTEASGTGEIVGDTVTWRDPEDLLSGEGLQATAEDPNATTDTGGGDDYYEQVDDDGEVYDPVIEDYGYDDSAGSGVFLLLVFGGLIVALGFAMRVSRVGAKANNFAAGIPPRQIPPQNRPSATSEGRPAPERAVASIGTSVDRSPAVSKPMTPPGPSPAAPRQDAKPAPRAPKVPPLATEPGPTAPTPQPAPASDTDRAPQNPTNLSAGATEVASPADPAVSNPATAIDPLAPRPSDAFAPRKDNPFAPRKDNPFAPRATNPFAPPKDNPFAPRKDNPFAPPKENPFAPKADKPIGQKPDEPSSS